MLPYTWKRGRLVFVDSMGDLFCDAVGFERAALVHQAMADITRHRFIILTKRPRRMREFYAQWWRPDVYDEFVRGGQTHLRERLFLREAGCDECGYGFLGCLRGRKQWRDQAITPNWRIARTVGYWGRPNFICDGFEWSAVSHQHGCAVEMQNGEISVRTEDCVGGFPGPLKNLCLGVSVSTQGEWCGRVNDLRSIPAACRLVSVEPMLGPVSARSRSRFGGLRGIEWVVCGPETGPGRREMKREWAVALRDECQQAGVAFFWKGEPDEDLPREWPRWVTEWRESSDGAEVAG